MNIIYWKANATLRGTARISKLGKPKWGTNAVSYLLVPFFGSKRGAGRGGGGVWGTNSLQPEQLNSKLKERENKGI